MVSKNGSYTPGSTHIAMAGKWTWIESMYFPVEHGDIPAMLVYQRVIKHVWRKFKDFFVGNHVNRFS